jgi:hypothetical protein
MIICERCGWLVPVDCTCHRGTDELSRVRLRSEVADRHREAVRRAHRSGWPGGNAPAGPRGRVAG